MAGAAAPPACLEGAIVQRVDLTRLVAVLHARLPGRTTFLVIAAVARGPAVGLLDQKPWKGAGLPGDPAPLGEKLRWRARLEGARVEALGARRMTRAS
jgi:hypothetical protein